MSLHLLCCQIRHGEIDLGGLGSFCQQVDQPPDQSAITRNKSKILEKIAVVDGGLCCYIYKSNSKPLQCKR